MRSPGRWVAGSLAPYYTDSVKVRTVADRLADPGHAGAVEGAARVGQAADGARLAVRIGLWLESGQVRRARFQASSCAALIAYADLACELLEADGDRGGVDAAALRRGLPGVHPLHQGRAELVAEAVRVALGSRALEGGGFP